LTYRTLNSADPGVGHAPRSSQGVHRKSRRQHPRQDRPPALIQGLLGYASGHDCRVNCGLRSADRRAGAPGECSVWGARLTDGRCPPESLWTTMRSSRRLARDSASGVVDGCGPKSPDSHRAVWGLISRPPVFPAGFLRFPGCPPGSSLRPPSSGFPSSGVLRFVPFGRCPVPVPPRFPSGFPFPWAIFTLALPRGGSAGVGPRRPGPRSPALPRPSRLDRAIRPHSRWAAAGHDRMPPQNRLSRAAAERTTSPRPSRPKPANGPH